MILACKPQVANHNVIKTSVDVGYLSVGSGDLRMGLSLVVPPPRPQRQL